MPMQVRCQLFKSHFKSWETMVEEATVFASTIPRANLINISMSADSGKGVISVWFWQ